MKIAVNARFLLNEYLEGYGYFLYDTWSRIARDHPADEFIFLFDRPYGKRFVFAKNILPVIAGPAARHPWLWKWWYAVKVPAVLKRYKADVFVSGDGLCSPAAKVPQCLLVPDLVFAHHPSFLKRSQRRFYKKNIPASLRKADAVVTLSASVKEEIVSRYGIPAEKMNVIYNAAKEVFSPAEAAQKERTRQKYTAGENYFVYAGALHPQKNLRNLLKAFSIFKKRQKSNWKLVLTGPAAGSRDPFLESLKTYKYRQDVVVTGRVQEEELVHIIGSAYVLVDPSPGTGFGVLEAMRCQVPVITSTGPVMHEIAGEAALYADPDNHTDLAEKLMQIYKDEALRNRLVDKGKLVTQQFSGERTACLLWETILKACGHGIIS